MIEDLHFTPTERRILKVLSDGKPHTRKELFACLPDDLASLSSIKPHLTKLRKKLRPLGQEIVCLIEKHVRYQHVHVVPVNERQDAPEL